MPIIQTHERVSLKQSAPNLTTMLQGPTPLELVFIHYLLTSPSTIVFWGILFGKSCAKIEAPAGHKRGRKTGPNCEALDVMLKFGSHAFAIDGGMAF